MRSSTILSLLVLTACSGSGVSTTARTTTDAVGETGDADADADDDDADADADADDSEGDADDDSGSDDTAMPSDTSGDPTDASASADEDSDDTNTGPVTLQGSWLSEGENIAPLLADLTGAVAITATFGENTFTVVTLDDQGQEVQQVGVYTETASGNGEIFEIVLEQTMPSVITVEGIYEVDNSVDPPVLRYEVVQTEPSVGAIPPTAEGGFGSTSFGADLTQIYVRQ